MKTTREGAQAVKFLLILALALTSCAAPRYQWDAMRPWTCNGPLYRDGVLWTAADGARYGWPSGGWRCEVR